MNTKRRNQPLILKIERFQVCLGLDALEKKKNKTLNLPLDALYCLLLFHSSNMSRALNSYTVLTLGMDDCDFQTNMISPMN